MKFNLYTNVLGLHILTTIDNEFENTFCMKCSNFSHNTE